MLSGEDFIVLKKLVEIGGAVKREFGSKLAREAGLDFIVVWFA